MSRDEVKRDRGRRRQGAARRGRQRARHRLAFRIQPRDLLDRRTRFQPRGLRGGDGRAAPDARAADHPQPARDGRGGDAQHLCRPDRMVRPQHPQPRQRGDLAAHAQRPRHRRRRGRAGADGGRRPRRGLPVRQWRAHRQLRSRDRRAQHVHARRRSGARLLGHRRGRQHGRTIAPTSRSIRATPYAGDLVFTAFSGSPSGRDQEGLRRAGRSATTSCGTCPICRSTPPISAAATRR